MAARCQPREQQIGGGRQQRARHQHAQHADARCDQAADERADQRHDHAVELRDLRDFFLGEAEVAIERIGHHAHHDVRHPVGRDQQQHEQRVPAVAREEVDEGADERAVDPDRRARDGARRRGSRGEPRGHRRFVGRCDRPRTRRGLGRDQRGQHADEHRGCHHAVGDGPRPELIARFGRVEARGDPQRAGARPDHADAIAGLVRGRERRLILERGRLDAIGVERDVLRGRCERDQQRQRDQQAQAECRVRPRHRGQADDDGKLRQQQPAAAAAEQAMQQRQAHAVDERRPCPLERVDPGNPADEADRLEVDARFAQPERQRAEHQQQRQAGREAEQQHAHDGCLGIDAPGGAPVAARRSRQPVRRWWRRRSRARSATLGGLHSADPDVHVAASVEVRRPAPQSAAILSLFA